ncbi:MULTISPECIES: cell division protein FtsL [unclassified Streptococcus]|uniref:cell division protein FtsL n=1 Tax=unclassified Streptococcus TaxID=2608887 RepID=UPI0018AB8F6A|nr:MULTISPECIES: cell division protein FtsL [unclassified Streptococcus]MBF8970034.1 cell division protein FtsL [Streptococcus sp. NLN76]MBG9367250.1 cell division protein FtsL [Streptococcus sp. NLN64]MBJ6746510.1 cell division protein FtsL [Streptococcus sp. 121]
MPQDNRPGGRFRRPLSRLEKLFYGTIVATTVIVAIATVFLQTQILQVERDLATLNSQVERKQTEITEAKQQVNELSRYERFQKLAEEQGMSVKNDNLVTADKP